MRNIFNEAFKFSKRSFPGIVIPIHFIITYMLQSGTYILAPDFIAYFKKMNFDDATTLWNIVFNHEATTVKQVINLLFDAR